MLGLCARLLYQMLSIEPVPEVVDISNPTVVRIDYDLYDPCSRPLAKEVAFSLNTIIEEKLGGDARLDNKNTPNRQALYAFLALVSNEFPRSPTSRPFTYTPFQRPKRRRPQESSSTTGCT